MRDALVVKQLVRRSERRHKLVAKQLIRRNPAPSHCRTFITLVMSYYAYMEGSQNTPLITSLWSHGKPGLLPCMRGSLPTLVNLWLSKARRSCL